MLLLLFWGEMLDSLVSRVVISDDPFPWLNRQEGFGRPSRNAPHSSKRSTPPCSLPQAALRRCDRGHPHLPGRVSGQDAAEGLATHPKMGCFPGKNTEQFSRAVHFASQGWVCELGLLAQSQSTPVSTSNQFLPQFLQSPSPAGLLPVYSAHPSPFHSTLEWLQGPSHSCSLAV